MCKIIGSGILLFDAKPSKQNELPRAAHIFTVQGDTSKMGRTLRSNPCFNTVPLQLYFQITLLTNAVVCQCTGKPSNLKKSWGGTVLYQDFDLKVCPILEVSPCTVNLWNFGTKEKWNNWRSYKQTNGKINSNLFRLTIF